MSAAFASMAVHPPVKARVQALQKRLGAKNAGDAIVCALNAYEAVEAARDGSGARLLIERVVTVDGERRVVHEEVQL